jgi:membrane protease subunit HflK
MAAESAMREVIGQNKLTFALTDGRGQIADETRTRLQALLDEYNTGVVISQINLQTVSVPDEVKAAFQDVINARLDQERFQNQAATHVNKVVPDAKGQAAQMLQQAMAYRDQKIALAKGDADRFKEVLMAYNMSRDVTARRLYLETMESVLGKAPKIIMEKSSGAALLPYFPMPQMSPPPRAQSLPVKEGGQP